MTNEEKQLLLKDLCARLPYGVIVDNPNPAGGAWDEVINIETFTKTVTLLYNGRIFSIDDIKPYLRPMSSMTEEERKEYESFIFTQHHEWDGFGTHTEYVEVSEIDKFRDWCNSHHFDYRGLIPIGLALEAKEDMYKEE